METEHPEILHPLKADRGTEARYALYRRLQPTRTRPVGAFPVAVIGAVAVIPADREYVTNSNVVARMEPPPATPEWTSQVLDEIRKVAMISRVTVRVGRNYGTIVAEIVTSSAVDYAAQVGAIQAAIPRKMRADSLSEG